MLSYSIFSSPIFLFIFAAFLGSFLGIHYNKKSDAKPETNFLGVRTCMLISIFGLVSTLFHSSAFVLISFSALVFLTLIVFAYGCFQKNKIGLTNEITCLLIFCIGLLVGYSELFLAIFLTIILFAIQEFREKFRLFATTLKPSETRGALQLLFISGIILPFLPQHTVDPWGIFNPFNLWLLVIFISALSFLGYFLAKYFGEKSSIMLSSILGALVSSTTVTLSLATKSKNSKRTTLFASAILVAMGIMFIRSFIEILVIGGNILNPKFLLVPVFLGLASFGCAYFLYKRIKTEKKNSRPLCGEDTENLSDYKLNSPFEILPALQATGMIVLVLVAIHFGNKFFGSGGAYLASFLSGFADVDAVIISSIESVKNSNLDVNTAQNSIFIALIVNTLVKVGYIGVLGSREFFQQIIKWILLVCILGGVIVFVL